MKNSKKILLSLVAVLLMVTACGKVPKLENGQEAVITLKDGEDISIDELYGEMKNKYALAVLLDMIDEQILEKLYPADDEEKEYIDSQVEQYQYYYDSYYSSEYKTFESFIYAMYGVNTEEEMREVLSLNHKRDLATTDYIKDEVITDKEIEDYYEKNTIGQMRASHILIKANYASDASDDEIEKAKNEAKEKAEKLIDQLNDADKDEVKDLFAKLAKENSDDSSKDKGGDIGWFDKGDMVEPFEEATKKLDVDEYTSEPVESEYGYHIILKTGQKEKPALKDAKESILEDLAEDKKDDDDTLQVKALKALREKHGLEIQDTELKKQYKTYLENNQ